MSKVSAKVCKIVFIGGRDIRIAGGIETFMLNLSAELLKKNVQTVIYCESDHWGKENIDGREVIFLKSLPSRFITKPVLALLSTLHALIHHRDASLIHYNAWPPSLSCWLPRLFGIPSLMHGHGLEWKRSKYTPAQQRIMKFMERFTARINQHLIMCSQEQTEYFASEYNRNAATVTGGVYLPDEIIPDEDKYLQQWGLFKDSYILFIGRLVKEKNPEILIQAYQKMKHRGRFKLVIAGDNSQMPEYVQYLKNMAIDDRDIIFTGNVYGDSKNSLLKNCFCFCLPSSLEGLPITLLEAMAYKRPCIVSDIPACHEAIEQYGFYVAPEDVDSLKTQLDFLAVNSKDFSEYYHREFDLVSTKYIWDKIVLKYLSAVQNMI